MLSEENRKKQEQTEYLKIQKQIANQKTQTKVIYKNQPQNQNNTQQQQSNPVVDKVQDEVIKQGVGMLLDRLF